MSFCFFKFLLSLPNLKNKRTPSVPCQSCWHHHNLKNTKRKKQQQAKNEKKEKSVAAQRPLTFRASSRCAKFGPTLPRRTCATTHSHSCRLASELPGLAPPHPPYGPGDGVGPGPGSREARLALAADCCSCTRLKRKLFYSG